MLVVRQGSVLLQGSVPGRFQGGRGAAVTAVTSRQSWRVTFLAENQAPSEPCSTHRHPLTDKAASLAGGAVAPDLSGCHLLCVAAQSFMPVCACQVQSLRECRTNLPKAAPIRPTCSCRQVFASRGVAAQASLLCVLRSCHYTVRYKNNTGQPGTTPFKQCQGCCWRCQGCGLATTRAGMEKPSTTPFPHKPSQHNLTCSKRAAADVLKQCMQGWQPAAWQEGKLGCCRPTPPQPPAHVVVASAGQCGTRPQAHRAIPDSLEKLYTISSCTTEFVLVRLALTLTQMTCPKQGSACLSCLVGETTAENTTGDDCSSSS